MHLDAIDAVIRDLYDGAVRRENERESPAEAVRELIKAGAGALRVPQAYGGPGLGVRALAEVLIDLAAADSNLSQILRGHLGLVEALRLRPAGAGRDRLLRAAAAGEFFGPAGAERTGRDLRSLSAYLAGEGDALYLHGEKYYTTGSLFADRLNVLVPYRNGYASAVVPRHAPGVEIIDDWDGFGQRLTASGTAVFTRVPVDPELLFPHEDAAANDYLDAFYQFVHSATQAGIIRRLAEDLAALVRGRVRSYPLAPVPSPRSDPQVLAVVGQVHSHAFAARAAVLSVADALGAWADAAERDPALLETAVLHSASAQVLNTRLAGEASWIFFDAASASALKSSLALDRHWRNARTVSSHNPAIYKAALIGQYAVNGALPGGFLNSRDEEPS
ncbi:acyl-CoA dehydrogenase family protein [Nonomuraea sp. NPDC049309]|uniref:acyl-CoA dehydrogenase family protein n=1 Tax=Nonomuraea sp. NPDC049309 TaxID=3364350 RepID=UPI00372087D2